MSKIIIYKSNRLENLAQKYHELLSENPAPPLVTEPIIVQSIGMGRWLSLYLAEKSGIWANFKYLFPNAFIRNLYYDLNSSQDDFKLLKKEELTWIIMRCLGGTANLPEYKMINDYIQNNPIRRYQLSEKIADTFDQYAIYRPEMLRRWSRGKKEVLMENAYNEVGEDDLWQPLLWKKIESSTSLLDRAALQLEFLNKLNSLKEVTIEGCNRITVFGVSTLPAYHLELLDALAEKISVYFFLMAPSIHYWEDIVSNKYKSILDKKALDKKVLSADLHYEEGNSLLGSLGSLGQDFSKLLARLNPREAFNSEDLFAEPGTASSLNCLQSAILNLRDRETENDLFGKGTPFKIKKTDHSLAIHSCHTPMREAEVLYNQILNILNEDKNIAPRDILVMTPDIEEYAPYIEAVFGTPEDDKQAIPFSIADRNMRHESQITDAFMHILTLQEKRFALSEVLDLLSNPEVSATFNLQENDIEKISKWCNLAGIRWGRDSNDRESMAGVAYKQNSWQYGLERMLLGYACSGNMEKLYADILPFENIEGSDADILGRFMDFISKLLALFEKLNQNHSLKNWSKITLEILNDFFTVALDNKWEVDIIKDIASTLVLNTELANYTEEIEFEVICYYLQNAFNKDPLAFGFLTGRVTFCAMLPMRSIPFKVIALIGMNGRIYPRVSRAIGFDLINKWPCLGDRSQKNDDRYIFLETILSARERLYISYQGRSAKDNSEFPPSILVSELLDYIKENFTSGEAGELLNDQTVKDLLVTEHSLQHFNRKYFNGNNDEFFSFSKDYFKTALLQGNKQNPSFFNSDLTGELPDELVNISMDDLINFYVNPSRYLLQTRLGIFLKGLEEENNNEEPFDELPFTAHLQVEEKLLNNYLVKNEELDYEKIFKAAAIFPPGNSGAYLFNQYRLHSKIFSRKLLPFLGGNKLELEKQVLTFDFEDEKSLILSINFTDLFQTGILKYRGEQFHKDKITLWINHLVLNILKPAGIERISRFIYPDKSFTYRKTSNAFSILNGLIRHYYKGLKYPLRFFPKVSEKYADELLLKNKNAGIALSRAIDLWNNSHVRTESSDQYAALAFRNNENIFNQEFKQLAEQFYAPLFEHLEEEVLV